MFIAMNRFQIVPGKEKDFEEVWRNRDTHLEYVPGFCEFHLVKGKKEEDYTLYASHTVWESKEAFQNGHFLLLFKASGRLGGVGGPLLNPGCLGLFIQGFKRIFSAWHPWGWPRDPQKRFKKIQKLTDS